MVLTNEDIAGVLEQTGQLLEAQQANPFRVRSYHTAATSVRRLDRPVAEIYRQSGEAGLRELDGIGTKLASSLREIVETGRLGLHDRLEAEVSPEKLISRVPGIGRELALRIHDELGISSLEDLEQAAHNGRLARVQGIGRKRLQGIQDSLAGILGRSLARRARERTEDRPVAPEPSVGLLLELDREYRKQAESHELPRIAPKRFNPNHEAWLPIMNAQRASWELTLLFSNTKRAHELNKTQDWVVAYYSTDHEDGQSTIMTAGTGQLRGKRIVRGRENECRDYYRQHPEIESK